MKNIHLPLIITAKKLDISQKKTVKNQKCLKSAWSRFSFLKNTFLKLFIFAKYPSFLWQKLQKCMFFSLFFNIWIRRRNQNYIPKYVWRLMKVAIWIQNPLNQSKVGFLYSRLVRGRGSAGILLKSCGIDRSRLVEEIKFLSDMKIRSQLGDRAAASPGQGDFAMILRIENHSEITLSPTCRCSIFELRSSFDMKSKF